MKHCKAAIMMLVVLDFALFCGGCGKSEQTPKQPSKEGTSATAPQHPQKQNAASQAASEKQSTSADTGTREATAGGRGDALSDPARDAIELTIVLYARYSGLTESGFNVKLTGARRVEGNFDGQAAAYLTILDPETRERLSKHKAAFEMDMAGELFSTPVEQGTKYIISSGSVLRCAFHGDLKLTVSFTAGAVGIQNNEVFVEDGTKCQVDANGYVFHGGRWRKQP